MADWDRQEGEPGNWFDRFERFRRMGPQRSLLAAAAAEANERQKKFPGHASGAWRDAAERWRWKARAAAWDAEQTRLAREEEADSLAQRRKAWIAQALALQGVGGQALLRLQEMVQDEGAALPLTPRDVLSFLGEGVRLELLARGEATEKHDHSHSHTVDDRRAGLADLLSSLRQRAAAGGN